MIQLLLNKTTPHFQLLESKNVVYHLLFSWSYNAAPLPLGVIMGLIDRICAAKN